MKTHILDEGWESNNSSLDMMRVKYVCVIYIVNVSFNA